MDGEKVEPQVSKWEVDYLKDRVTKLEKQVKLLLAVMVEKKMIGDAMKIAIQETASANKGELSETAKWFLDQLKEK